MTYQPEMDEAQGRQDAAEANRLLDDIYSKKQSAPGEPHALETSEGQVILAFHPGGRFMESDKLHATLHPIEDTYVDPHTNVEITLRPTNLADNVARYYHRQAVKQMLRDMREANQLRKGKSMNVHEEVIAPLLDKLLEAGANDLILTGESRPVLMSFKGSTQEYRDVEGTEIISGESLNEVIRSIRLADRSDTGEYDHKGERFNYALVPGAILLRHVPSQAQLQAEATKLAEFLKAKFPTDDKHEGLRTATEVFRTEGK